MLLSVMVFAFLFSASHVTPLFTSGDSTTGISNTAMLWTIPFAGICVSWGSLWPTPLPTAFIRGQLHTTHFSCPQQFHQYNRAFSFMGSGETYLIPLPFLHDRKGSSFPFSTSLSDTVYSESVMGIKPGDSGVMIGYWVDEFTHIWLAKHFIAQSHIYHSYLLGTGESYGPTAQHTQDSRIFFIQLNYVYNRKE